jgi:hypothetical protein
MLGSATYLGSGQYTQLLLSPSSSTANVVVSAAIEGNTIVDTAIMNFYGAISLSTSTLTALPSTILADGTSTSLIVLQAKDANSITIPVGGETGLALSTTGGTLLASLVDNANGTYTQSLQSSVSTGNYVVSATKSSVPFSDTAPVEFYTASNLAGVTITCDNISTYKNGPIYVTSGTLIMDPYTGTGAPCTSEFVFTSVILSNTAILTHPATTSVKEYGLEFSAQTLTIDNTSKIDVTAKGYPIVTNGYFRVQGNQDVSGRSAAPSYSGGCHGGVGGIREAKFEKGLMFLETITDWEKEQKLTFKIRSEPANTPLTTLDSHVVVGGRYFDTLIGQYEIEKLSNQQVRLHLFSRYRLSTRFNFYAEVWSDFLMRDIQENILKVIRLRAENLAYNRAK